MSIDSSETTTPPTSSSSSGGRLRGSALGLTLAALMLTLLLEALDQTVVGTALPKISASLQGFDLYTWVVTAYLLASTAMIPISAKLSDQFGRKWFLVGGAVIFLIGSALCGLSQTAIQLIIFRAIQGLGAGTGIALVFTVVGDIFTPAERARWQGIFTSVYGFSSVLGPSVGGWLTDHGPLVGSLVTDDTRWRWVFYVNLPFGIAALTVLLLYLPSNLSLRTNRFRGWAAIRRIDFAGSLLASAATISLLLGLTWGGNQTYAWTSPQVLGTLIGSGVLYITFVIVERFVPEPILPLDLFRNRIFTVSSLLSLAQGMALLGLVVYLPLFLQGVLKESATTSGALITPMTVSLTVGAAFCGIMIGRLGRYQFLTIIGSVILGVGVFLLTRMDISTSAGEATLFMVITGLGLGMFFPVLTLAVQNAIPRSRLGVGTGAVRYMQATGQVLGVAIIGTVVNNSLAVEFPKRIPAQARQFLPAQALQAAQNPQVLISPDFQHGLINTSIQQALLHGAPPSVSQTIPALYQQVFEALREALSVSIIQGYLVVFGICIATFLLTFLLKDVPLRKQMDEPGTAQAGESSEAEAAPIGI
ncbi:MAG TPA: MDR family MFS transporter [Ktedonobacterales bacterium]|nr:MDR family MFS transporter [Ktedonobacterales bacterium]